MISKSIGLAIWVLCTIALYIIAVLAYRRHRKAEKYLSCHHSYEKDWGSEWDVGFDTGIIWPLAALIAVMSTIGLVGWLMTGGLGI